MPARNLDFPLPDTPMMCRWERASRLLSRSVFLRYQWP